MTKRTDRNNASKWLIRGVLVVLIVGLASGYWWYQYEPPVNDLYRWQVVTDDVSMPTSMTPLDENRVLISELFGQIKLMENGTIADALYLDLTDKVIDPREEQGLFRVLADPNYAENGYIYVHYTAEPDGRTVVERYTVSADNPDMADPDSAELVFELEQPDPFHNGGDMQFGADGYLYIALGESHMEVEAQNLESYYGSILRIDVSNLPYTIPDDNPFVNNDDALGEIFAYGLRNPWRFSIDHATGDVWVSDLGDANFEEVNLISAETSGQNFGWPVFEGINKYKVDLMTVEGATPPVHEYQHYQFQGEILTYYCGITGGYVYRGEQLRDLQGKYIFTDRCQGDIWTLTKQNNGRVLVEDFMDTSFIINSFGEDADGELYALTIKDIWKLVAR